ncbi:D-alanyl-D-alanine carboxypeptidase [Paenibacillus sp. J31TS4]|uniref:D-alanyl-D-alanine carboxypeptidase family protein n=1 Tax=Paenibacillus sp. J31TS4 TaxID=2807195 RepID=UPI001B29D581|nr:D-alanyl-D-alanine carboxypeptidase family protein [Paenibacillus sp. J31TS4]GIP40889.1 D-alanyl-D-alanine carboxypeptidase [Paenibacillus sp. J31TS4]
MKKRYVVLLLLLGLIIWQAPLLKQGGPAALFHKAESLFDPGAETRAAIVIDAQTGKELYAKNADLPYPAASMSKMMTEYLLLEAVANKQVRMTDSVTVSRNAAEAGGATVELKAGRAYPLQDLYAAMVVGSANNAAVAIGEHLAGSTQEFAKRMNKKAEELGLQNALFVNATGLAYSYGENHMSARDASKLAQRLLKDFPEILSLTSQSSVVLKSTGEKVENTNAMLGTDKPSMQVGGMDGLKTGFTDQAGYCFTGTAKQGDRRVISVVMGTPTEEQRFTATKKLMDRGFKKS